MMLIVIASRVYVVDIFFLFSSLSEASHYPQSNAQASDDGMSSPSRVFIFSWASMDVAGFGE